jgi:vancomycin aglycone glucosyltransferase
MRVLLSTYDSRGGVEPLAALAVRLQELGAEALVCAPPDCAERLAEVGVPLVAAGEPVRALVHAAKPPSPDDVPRLTAELIATWFDKVAAAAEGCDALVASGVIPAAVGARSVAEKLGIGSVHVSYCPIFLPSPHHPPHPLPGRPLPPDVTDNQVLWDLDAQGYNAVFGAALNTHRVANGLPPVDNVRHYLLGDHPWLAADPVLAPWPEPADLDVVQTGAWILPDERPLPAELEAFLDADLPPVYVGFGSMRAPADVARVVIEAIRAQGCRAVVARGWPTWPRSTTGTTAWPSARSTSRHCSAGWLPSCTTAARAPRRPLPGPACRRWWCPSGRTSRTLPAGWPTWASARPTTFRPRLPSPCPPRSAWP